MKKRIIGGIVLLAAIFNLTELTGCKTIAKNMGGTITIDVPKGQKIIEATWKNANLWYLTRPMTDDDIACSVHFF